MKKLLIIMLLFISSISIAEVPIKYDNKICKLEIISSSDVKVRNSKEVIKNVVLEFCKNKYIYNIELAIDGSSHTYIIIYNDIAN